MNEIMIKGTQVFMGKEIPIIYGGFGAGQKVILAKIVADIHDVRLNDINDLINNNLNEFDINIDLLDLKNSTDSVGSLFELGFSKQSIANSTSIYLLSEQGYIALVGLMRTDKAREIRKEFRREYFVMKEQIQQNNLPTNYIESLEALLKSEKEKLILTEKLEEQEPEVILARAITGSSGSIPVGDMAKILNQNGIKIGRNRFFEYLREQKYLMKDGRNYNKPTQRSMDLGIMEYEETVIKTPLREKIEITPLITGEGQKYFVNKFLKEGMKENKKMGIFEQINLAFDRL